MRLTNHLNIESEDWQACYSSQLYGTFFSIYARPTGRSSESDSNSIELESIDLRIINYKGPVNLDIVRAEFRPDLVNGNGGTIDIEVQALYDSGELIHAVDCGNHPFVKGKTPLRFHRFLKPMHQLRNNIPVALNNGVFDSEFFDREGLYPDRDLGHESDFPGKDLESLPDTWDDRLGINSDVHIGAGGILCPYSWVFLI